MEGAFGPDSGLQRPAGIGLGDASSSGSQWLGLRVTVMENVVTCSNPQKLDRDKAGFRGHSLMDRQGCPEVGACQNLDLVSFLWLKSSLFSITLQALLSYSRPLQNQPWEPVASGICCSSFSSAPPPGLVCMGEGRSSRVTRGFLVEKV